MESETAINSVEELYKFKSFPKISRFNRPIIITEKLDGTNAQICIPAPGVILAGSRNRWLTAEADNFGFYRWVMENKDDLMKLGTGRHYGEWYGQGIQRGYALGEKRFALFNTERWGDPEVRPLCCETVPVLLRDDKFTVTALFEAFIGLAKSGSWVNPGYMNPEGIVLHHVQSNQSFKLCFDDVHKTETKEIKNLQTV